MENQNAVQGQALELRVKEILEQFGLDFIIEKHPMIAVQNVDGLYEKRFKSDYFGLINSKTQEVIHTVKKGYTVSQNKEIVEMVLRGIEGFGTMLSVTKAGILNGGRKVFIQLEVEKKGYVGDDTITKFITIIDSNDGSTGLSIGIGDVTLSCLNQFVKFYKKSNAIFRHTATIEQKIKTIPSVIEKALAELDYQEGLYNKMAAAPIEEINIHEMVKEVLGYDKKITAVEVMATKKTRSLAIMEELYNHISKELNCKGWNWWGLHSGVTSYTTHAKKYPKRENGEIESLMIGGAYQMNQKSFEFAKKKLGLE